MCLVELKQRSQEEVELSIQILSYSTLSFPMRDPSLYSVKKRWMRRLG
jgi:hypothetical protein